MKKIKVHIGVAVIDGQRIAQVFARRGGVLVGMATGRFGKIDKPCPMWITNVWVNPSYRRGGVGSVLIKRLKKTAKDWDLPAMSLSVKANNDGAIAMYRRLGFYHVSTYSGDEEIHLAWVNPEHGKE